MSLFAELQRRNVFRVAAAYVILSWLLLQVGDILFEALELPDWTMKLVVALLTLGFIPTVIFSWAYELTPEGVKKESEVDRSQSVTHETGRKLDYITIAMVVAGVGFALYNHYVLETPAPIPQAGGPADTLEPGRGVDSNSIAVLPFSDLSPERDQEYFSHGIAEEILNVLVRIDGLAVASRTSSFQFVERDQGIPEIAQKLKVRHVLEGSVRKAGDTLRITAQLIDAANDRHLWSDTYDRPLTAENVFSIQDEIASAIVDQLSTELNVSLEGEIDVRVNTENLDAYELYLRAKALFLGRNRLDEADELLALAVALDPEFADAWELRGAAQTLMKNYGYSDLSRSELEKRAREYAERALAIDPDSATALATLSLLRMGAAGRREWQDHGQIIRGLTQALELDPRNAEALTWRGLAYADVGDLEAALTDFETCVSYEPFYAPCHSNRNFILGALGRETEAYDLAVQGLTKGVPKVLESYLNMLARLGRKELFMLITNANESLEGWRRHDELFEATRSARADVTDLARDMQEFANKQGLEEPPFRLILAIPGRWEEVRGAFLFWDPAAYRFRQTEEFKQIIRDMGVFDYWKKQGFPSLCRPLGEQDFECD